MIKDIGIKENKYLVYDETVMTDSNYAKVIKKNYHYKNASN